MNTFEVRQKAKQAYGMVILLFSFTIAVTCVELIRRAINEYRYNLLWLCAGCLLFFVLILLYFINRIKLKIVFNGRTVTKHNAFKVKKYEVSDIVRIEGISPHSRYGYKIIFTDENKKELFWFSALDFEHENLLKYLEQNFTVEKPFGWAD